MLLKLLVLKLKSASSLHYELRWWGIPWHKAEAMKNSGGACISIHATNIHSIEKN